MNQYECREVTPRILQCGIGACPRIYLSEGKEDYFIIGETVHPEEAGLVGKVGANESLIKVPRKLIDEREG